MSTLAKEYGITKAVVQSDRDAQKICSFFEYILVLADIPKVADTKIRYSINDINAIKEFPKGTLVELKVNTGMNRNGIEIEELELALEMIKSQGLVLEGVLTHHACADELNEFYDLQCANFEKVKQLAPKGLRFHSCNSAALFRAKNFDEDMARVGIAAYGCMDLPKEINDVELKPVLSLYAEKISSRVVKKGEYVGYGASFTPEKEVLVSNYNFGYGDGFFRACSNRFVSADGAKLVGKISMDNASFISDAQRLLIFDDARVIATPSATFSYEVLTSLKPKIKRKIV